MSMKKVPKTWQWYHGIIKGRKEAIEIIDNKIGELSSDDSVKTYIECGCVSKQYNFIMIKIGELERLKELLKQPK